MGGGAWLKIGGIVLAAGLAACGGGGGDEEEDDPQAPVGPGWTVPSPPLPGPTTGATVDGVFRDALVQGLDYSDGGALAGTTGADGRFQYAQGNTVTFRIGGLTLGSLQGQPYMSPLHIVGSSSNLAQRVNNRLRLLQMLDLDNNPENGIVISEAVRAVAAGWATPDFSVGYPEFATAIQPIISAANAADGITHTLPSDAAASAHFVRTAWCTYNGLYRGTYTGSGDNGVWTMVVYGTGALMFGGGYSSVDREGFELQKQAQTGLSIFPDFSAGQTSSGASFSGSFRTPDHINGNWSNAPDTGTFLGGRVGGSGTARYRMSGYAFPVGTALLMTFELDADDRVTGTIIDRDYLRTAEPVPLTGTLTGTALTASAAGNQYVLNGTFDKNAAPGSLQINGTLRDNVKNRDVQLNGRLPGCRLN
jgi:hypothetical protein